MFDNKNFGNKPTIQHFISANCDMVRVPYEITEISPGIYSWRELLMKYRNFNYGGLVSALIGLQYSDSQMTAIINNYLLDPENEDSKKEFLEMQEYRKYAKETARNILEENK